MHITTADAAGYAASFLVFLTFFARDMLKLRVTAIFSNLAFLTYGSVLGLTPIFLLHASLLILNSSRLIGQLRQVEWPEGG